MTAQHPLRGDVAVLVPAAGLGTRLGPGAPKALRDLAGASLLVHAIRRVVAAPSVGCVAVAAPPEHAEHARTLLADLVPAGVHLAVVPGGETRQLSVAAALAAVPPGPQIVLVHDAARALAPTELMERVAAAVRDGHDAVIPVLPVTDTVKQVDESSHVVATVDRSVLRVVQTPQGFRRPVLEAAHRAAVDPVTDDAALVEKIGVRVFCVPGAHSALKITNPTDLTLAELLLHSDG
ncbi:MAG TPA: 2-C-methyl-D-erythritol 4-phosphate cytidylyltransferase [Micromonosporaceae bacterium]|nr:2-C-methyl-D-erythritol 4-phosphate cytidylyltransferase [Micromonosporaceae bacterium]